MSLSLDKPVIITIDEYVKNRTNAQNRLMHQWFNKMSHHYILTVGEAYSPYAWKQYLKEKFLGFDMVEMPDGSVKAITKHTSDCSTTELTDFLEKIDHYARGIPFEAAERHPETAQMMIVNPLSGGGLRGLFSTHPATEERVARLLALAASMRA